MKTYTYEEMLRHGEQRVVDALNQLLECTKEIKFAENVRWMMYQRIELERQFTASTIAEIKQKGGAE